MIDQIRTQSLIRQLTISLPRLSTDIFKRNLRQGLASLSTSSATTDHSPLILQQAFRHRPAIVDRTDNILPGCPHIFKKGFTER